MTKSLSRRTIIATSRRWWRQLTSMRTALILLLFLAIAAVPGSLLPQRNLSNDQVLGYYAENPDLAPWVDRVWGFDVYSSPWFAAIYLLLFTSLVGCLVPRFRDHIRSLRRRPPDAPARLSILPEHATLPDEVTLERVTTVLRRRRFRTVVRDHDDGTVTVSAEKGYLREAGNLVFHFSLLVLLLGMAYGSLYGWYGNRLLVEGEDGAFCNSLQQYDEFGLGPNIDATGLPPFCVQMESFTDEYLDNGQPITYIADLKYGENGEAPTQPYQLEVNHPLEVDGASIFLLGHGYAPVISYTDTEGVTQTSTTPFIGDDGALTSSGAAVFPDVNVDPETGEPKPNSQMAFEGLFIPAVPDQPPYTQSTSPQPEKPAVMLSAFRGDTGLDSGLPQSVYEINPDQLESGALQPVDSDPELLEAGESWELDDGSVVTFEGVVDYATLEVRHDPGERIVLGASIAILVGLLPALTIQRRRVWVRLGETNAAAGLARNDYDGFTEEFTRLTDMFKTAQEK